MRSPLLNDLVAARRGEFLAPRQVLFGPGASGSVGEALRASGVLAGEVLVVADKVVAANGLVDVLLSGLQQSGFHAALFAEIAGEPDDRMVDAAASMARERSAAAVVGVGGGSAMDTAKLVALLVTNAGTTKDWLGAAVPPNPLATLVLVPTTTGTGAETTRISMVSVDGSKRIVSCPQFVPPVAALDPTLVAGLPSSVVASTGMDALAHAIESMLSENRSLLTLGAAAHATELLLTYLEAAVVDRDAHARGQLLYAAHFAGMALNAGVVLGHSIGYTIAQRTHLPHGTTTALALPYCLAYDQAVAPPVAEQIAGLITNGKSSSLLAAAQTVDSLSGILRLPRSLSAAGISAGDLPAMATETVRDYPRPNNPVPLEEDRVRRLLDHMFDGDLAGAWTAMGAGR